MEHLLFTVETVLPIFLIILLGMFLERKKIIDDRFVSTSNYIVFHIALPALIFSKIAATDFFSLFFWQEIGVMAASVLLLFGLSWIISGFISFSRESRASFVACSIHGNVAILGLAVLGSVFGDAGMAKGAIILSFIMPLYNVLTVTSLSILAGRDGALSPFTIVKRIARNPLILAALFALPFSLSSYSVPGTVLRTINVLSAMTLPVALIGIGASLSFATIRNSWKYALLSGGMKILLSPLLVLGLSLFFGFSRFSTGVMVLFAGAPTAVAAFIMSSSMGADGKLAASIITIDTLASLFTMGGAILAFRYLGWI
jgi:predicted permease